MVNKTLRTNLKIEKKAFNCYLCTLLTHLFICFLLHAVCFCFCCVLFFLKEDQKQVALGLKCFYTCEPIQYTYTKGIR